MGVRGAPAATGLDELATLPDLLGRQALLVPDRPFLQFGPEKPLTFAETDWLTTRLANGLRSLGVGHGDRVALLLPSCKELVLTWFGLAKLGAIEVPVNYEHQGDLLAYGLADCGARAAVAHSSKLPALLDVIPRLPQLEHVIVVADQPDTDGIAHMGHARLLPYDVVADGADTPVDAEVRHSDTMAILYTSGTTGPAKGVMLSHRGFAAWAESIARNMGLTGDDVYYQCLPLYYGDAQFMTTYFGLIQGGRVVFFERFSASRFWDQIRTSGATATNLLGTIAHILWKQEERETDRHHSLRICNSIPMPPFKAAFEERFGVRMVTGYGQTETNLVAVDSVEGSRPGSCGRAAPGYELAVVDEDDEPVPPGTVGEIVVRASRPWTMFQGYWGKPEATVQAWRNLWFHTGDAGSIDDEGWLYFVERLKDSIRRRGQNISAYELECLIEDDHDVLEAAAIAVPAELGEDEVKVLVVLRPGCQADCDSLVRSWQERLPRFMVPRYVELRTEPLPRTVSHKIAKRELREEWATPHTWDRERGAFLDGDALAARPRA